jgi:hypothetical protein
MTIWFYLFAGVVLLFGFVIVRGAPYVPSQRRYIQRALTELYKVDQKDVLVDIGSGDGIVLRMAAKLGARAVGYELNPALVLVSKILGNARTKTYLADFWLVELPPDTTVVYVFMVQKMSQRLEKKLQDFANQQRRSLQVVAYGIPFRQRTADKTLDAYFLYTFQPLQP